MKNISFFFLSENFQFLEVKFSIYLNRHVFVMFFLGRYSSFIGLPVLCACLSEYLQSVG